MYGSTTYTKEDLDRWERKYQEIVAYRKQEEKRRLQRVLRTKKRKLAKANNRRAK